MNVPSVWVSLSRSVFTHLSQAVWNHSLRVRVSLSLRNDHSSFFLFLDLASVLSFPVTRWWWSTNTLLVKRIVSLSDSCRGHILLFLYLYCLKIYPGVYGVQLAVQRVERRSFGGLGGPAVHHDAVNVLRTACWTGETKPGGEKIQHFFVTFS